MTGNRKHHQARHAWQMRRNVPVPAPGSPEDGQAMLAAFADAHAATGAAGGDTLDMVLLALARLPRGIVVMMRDTAAAMVVAADRVLRERPRLRLIRPCIPQPGAALRCWRPSWYAGSPGLCAWYGHATRRCWGLVTDRGGRCALAEADDPAHLVRRLHRLPGGGWPEDPLEAHPASSLIRPHGGSQRD